MSLLPKSFSYNTRAGFTVGMVTPAEQPVHAHHSSLLKKHATGGVMIDLHVGIYL